MLVSAGYSSSLAHFFYTSRHVLADLGRFMFLFTWIMHGAPFWHKSRPAF